MKGQPASTFEENNITFEAFTDLLEGKIKEPSKYYRIGSKNHEVSKFLQRKASLVSAFDDKRWMMDCMRHSLPYGSVYAKKEMQNHALFVKNKRTICKIYSLKKVMFVFYYFSTIVIWFKFRRPNFKYVYDNDNLTSRKIAML